MGHREDQWAGSVGNEVSGSAGHVVQARDVTGGVHVHKTALFRLPLPQQLPPEAAHFTGRGAELDRLDALLSGDGSGRPRPVVVTVIAGIAGIGKTSLAVRWAYRARDRFPDGQLYVNLRGHAPSPPMTARQALDHFLRALGFPAERVPQDLEAMAGMYRSALAGRRVLVVLDNAATPEQVRLLLPNGPGCAVLVTSRNRMAGLVARDGAHRVTLDVLTPAEAVALLRDIIGPDRAGRDPDATAQLAEQCAYLPLALRIAAERVTARPQLDIGDLVEELAAEHRRLDVLVADDDEVTAVRTVFSWSYRALPPEVSRVFRLLGLHPGLDISLDAVAALAAATPAQARQQLNVLASVHLLTEASPGRFEFHDLLRTYAGERAVADEPDRQRDIATRRLFEWYLHTAHAALFALYPQHPEIPVDPIGHDCRALDFIDRETARRWFTAEHANLIALIRRAPAVGLHTVGWQLPNAVDCYLGEYHHIVNRIAVHRLGLESARHIGHQIGQVWACNHLGEAYQDARRYEEAIACHREALRIAATISDVFGQAAALGDLASADIALGRYEEAASHSRRALDIYRSIDHRRNEGISLAKLGQAFRGMGLFDLAVDHLRQGLAIFQETGDVGGQAWTLRCLAGAYHEQGQNFDAVGYLQDSVVLYRQQESTHALAETLNDLGVVLNDLGRQIDAQEAWQEALVILTDLDPDQAAQVRRLISTIGPSEPS